MSEKNPVVVEVDGPVTTVIIDRAEKRNAANNAVAEGLYDAFKAFETDDQSKVAVLWGKGGHFCAGADLAAVAGDERATRYARLQDGSDEGPMGPSRLRLSKPVIAAVAGYAVAGGIELALWCDLRVMEESATFGVFCRRFGVPLIDGGTVRLPRLIGQSRAMDLILTGRPVDSAEALQFGLANRVVPDGTSREAAEALAHEIAGFPGACIKMDRANVYDQWEHSMEDAILQEFKRGFPMVEAEGKAGAARFVSGEGRGGAFKSE